MLTPPKQLAPKTLALLALAAAALLAIPTSPAVAAAPAAKLTIHSIAQPTYFQTYQAEEPNTHVDQYTLLVENLGSANSEEPVTVTDTLPAGVTTATAKAVARSPWNCAVVGVGASRVTCTGPALPSLSQHAESGEGGAIGIPVNVAPGFEGPLINTATVSAGGSSETTTEETPVGSPALVQALGFEPLDFSASAIDAAGALETQAAGHPAALTATFHFSSRNGDQATQYPGKVTPGAVEPVKQIVIDLPPGVVGNPQAAPKCSLTELQEASPAQPSLETVCPPDTRVGQLTIIKPPDEGVGAGAAAGLVLYNITPEKGYPAEFGVYEPSFEHAQLLYAHLVGTGANTHVQLISGPLTEFLEFTGISTIFDGNPGVKNHSGEAPRAFFTNPSDCSQPNFQTRIHIDTYEHPGTFNADGTPNFNDPNWKESVELGTNTPQPAISPAVTGCQRLQFNPSLSFAPEPEHGQADEPSGYETVLRVPQNEDPNDLAAPPLRRAVVTLPAGVAISPSAADGLLGCQATGGEGIELESDIAGHCPPKSTVGTAEVITPLLTEPLKGNVYVAEPACGGAGQPECSEAEAEKGELFKLYLEVGSEQSGVHIKLPGTVEVGGNGEYSRNHGLQPGQVRATFSETPQQPFSEMKLKFEGGPRAPLANPQSCGSFTTVSALTPWSSTSESAAQPSAPFTISGCTDQFAPAFSAGTVNPQAAASSPFTLTFSRQDREQDLSGITVDMPEGLLGKIAGIPQCGEAQANAGTCPAASRIGSATAAAGAGSNPYWQTGQVFLTGPYKGGPFGLSVVVPAKAGPYNLGNIVVRAAIYVDPHTAQLTVISDPLPQSVDGVPLRLQTVNVTVDREGFISNPTSCEPTQIAATLTGSGGASASVASRFQAGGCTGLPFKPVFAATTQAKTSKADGASLDVKIAQRSGEANIHRVDVQLPLSLPSRLTTLQKACGEAQFAQNPAGCPVGSLVGTATAATPLLNVALTGPAYLVSHGGAAFPDLDVVLQGEGVTIILVGNTDIKRGITYSRFETVPDAPISSFELRLPEGPDSLLADYGSLCAPSKVVTVRRRVALRRHGRTVHVLRSVKHTVAEQLLMPTTIVAQSGVQITQSTKIAVTGCPKVTNKKTKKESTKSKKRTRSRK